MDLYHILVGNFNFKKENMKYLTKTLNIALLLLVTVAYAQQEPNYTLYRYTMNAVNPAYAGSEGMTRITTNLRSQWSGVPDAPETQTLFAETTFGNRVGLGVSVVNDATFIENATSFVVDFSYKVPISDDSNLFLGLKAGGNTYDINRRKLVDLGFGDDPALGNVDTGFNPSIGAGAYLHNEKYFVAISAPNLLGSSGVQNDNGNVTFSNDKTHFYIAGGYNFDIGGDTEFRPSVMGRLVSGAPISVDFTAAFRFFDKFEIGGAYRTDEAFSGLAMLKLADWMDLGYAYESSTRSQISDISNGTHEILLRFNISKASAE